MNFQRYVIIFFVALLLIIMIFLGVTMSNNKATNVPWPPIISSCPDYWTDTPDELPEEFITECTETPNDNGTTEKCNLIPNPNYTNIPIPHVSGSRCIGTIGQNTGNYTTYDPKNSGCIWDGTNYTANCKTKKTSTVDFTSTGLNFIGANGSCQKQRWAKNSSNISWDGITYGYGENNPC